MTKEEYYNQKAKYAYQLYTEGKPFKKVYAAVKKGDKYIVLKNKKGNYKYSLSGGGVDPGEDNITAIKRELKEELNVNVKVVKPLGIVRLVKTWRYEGREFDVPYECEIFLTEFVSYANVKDFGLSGEFDDNFSVAEVSKKEMVNNVFEFTKGGIKFGE